MKRLIIGEGSYGCVHKPSIHCKTPPTPNFDYSKYVSKIMKKKNAEEELSEFVVISKFDKNNEYHLGTPILCEPDLDEANVKTDVNRCTHFKLDDIKDPNDISLLVLKFGGPDFKALCNKYLDKYLSTNKENKTDKFWLEAHQLIKGLRFFKENGIVHNDIKPQNVLFDSVTGKMKYIDFGLMRTKKEIIDSSKNSKNWLATFHWSYPFDCGFMNKNWFDIYKHSEKNRYKLRRQLSELICIKDTKNVFNMPIKRPEAFSILFTYINPDDTIPDKVTQYGYIDAFFDGFDALINSGKSYNEILEIFVDSIDVFSLGFTLQFIANCFKRKNALSLDQFTRLTAFFHKMYDFNPSTREIDIEKLLEEYENILLEIGVLTRLNKSFKDNNVITKTPVPSSIIKEDSKDKTEHLSAKLNKLANADPIDIINKCPTNKELNPKTKRCVNKCKDGFVRNADFKCVKTKKNVSKSIKSKTKTMKSKSFKRCPDNKELNPKTNRCVNKCRDGFIRNADFKCIKNKTKSMKSKSLKRCPDDKELNPKTNRCVNKCKDGFVRNDEFKCVKQRIKTMIHPLMS